MNNKLMNEILMFLRPQGGFVLSGTDLGNVRWDDGISPVSVEEFETAKNNYEIWKAEQEAAAKAQKQAILDRLGLTEDELRIVLG